MESHTRVNSSASLSLRVTGRPSAIGIEQNLENANINNMPRVVFKNKGNDTLPWFFQRLLHKAGAL